ncbi:putative bifunctional diguanylate cyclase/phosphodiesterase [Glaciibacter sp. 2TAF33]|uniref:putative bifunctional diguanylate cyclase/phosphodiesterase n=1 Tax=Glaciibacter sp. 2TAF33 TaxID=3233015 RepID=UPI003F8F0708
MTGWAVWVMTLMLAAHAAARVLHGDGFDAVIDGWMATSTSIATVVVAVVALFQRQRMRPGLLLAAAAVTSWAAAKAFHVHALDESGSLPVPSPADAGYLTFHVLMLAALVRLVHRRIRGLSRAVLLDSAIGALGAASVLAVFLVPMLDDSLARSFSLATVIEVTYTVLDLLLIAAVAGIASAHGLDRGRHWMLLAGGLVLFAVADIAYSLFASGYGVGSWPDLCSAVGLALVAGWISRSARSEQAGRSTRAGGPELTIPVASMIAAICILLVSSTTRVNGVAVVLAGATLAAAVAPLGLRQWYFRRQSRTDELTGLPNRRAFYTDVPMRIAANRNRTGALLMLDLDGFKHVNDSLGHDVGDQLLVKVSRRLEQQLHRGGHRGSLLARLGGDEFTLLLTGVDADMATTFAQHVCDALAELYSLDGIAVHSGASVGIAMFPQHGETLSPLLRKADLAMYKAKAARTGHHLYGDLDDVDGDTRLKTLDELRNALAAGQMVVHYQPKVDLRSGSVTGYEALVRWNHPVRGLLFPDAFLGLIEEAGLIRELTRVVLEQALDEAACWHAKGHAFTVAVNLSASSLVDSGMPRRVAEMVASRGLPPSALTLEVTEEYVIRNVDRARVVLTELRSRGFRIAIDDFGTGYSSLAYLRDLPIDELKLDRSFVSPITGDARAAALVSSTIDLAHALEMQVVAEGIESADAYGHLAAAGCDQGQGFHMSRAIPAAEIAGWLGQRPGAEPAGAEHASAVRNVSVG